MMRILLMGCLTTVVLCGRGAAAEQLHAVADDQGVTILDGDLPVLRYQRAVKSLAGKWPRANYVHPLFDLDGKVISKDFPTDHRHHRGVFWAWHQVRVGGKKLGDAWTCKRFIWDVQAVDTSADQSSQLIAATVLWKSPDHVTDDGELVAVVRENTSIRIHALTAKYRLIDFQISLLALVNDVSIGGSEDVKGYGGFSPRLVLNDRQRFVSADGEVVPVKTAIEAGWWINITDDQRGLAILSRASNPPPNQRWILRGKGSMQNAVYPGRDPVRLSTLKPTKLNYRLVIHRGELTSEEINSLQQDFDRQATPTVAGES